MAVAGASERGSPVLRWVVVIGFLGLLVMNVLAVRLPLAGRTTGEISALFPVSLTPAGYAFSIWSLIYAALAGFVIYQALPRQNSGRLDGLRVLFLLSCILNVAWLVAWHNLFIPLSLLLMLGLLVVLVLSYREARSLPVGRLATWFVRLPFSLYLGWISVATLVNVAVVLYDWGPLRTPWLDRIWTLLALALLTVVVRLVLERWRDLAYALVGLWAVVAIFVESFGAPLVAVASAVSALIIAIALFAHLRGRGAV